MGIKRTIILVVTIIMLIFIAGCNANKNESLPGQDVEDVEQGVEIAYGEINDYMELEKLWQEYFYHSIFTIGNNGGFNSAKEIDALRVAKFCWFKYVAEHGREGLDLVSKDSQMRLLPLDIVLDYAERYFNLTNLDLTNIDDSYYDFAKKAFIINLGSDKKPPSHTGRNSWGMNLEKVTRNSDGTITAILKHYDTYQHRRVQYIDTYTLKPRNDGSLYFLSCQRDYINNHLVSINGDFLEFEMIEGLHGYAEELSMLGEDNNKLIIAKMSYGKEQDASLLLLNAENMQVEKKFNLNSNLTYSDVYMEGEKILILYQDRIMVINKDLELLEEIPLPKTIKDKIERDSKLDKYNFPEIYFGGYDVSKDFKKIVYSDEIGVKLFHIADNSEVLPSPTVPISGSELIGNSFHSNPRFVADDKKVITIMAGYESPVEYSLYNLEEGTCETHNIVSEGSSTGFIRYDTGLLEINTHFYNKESQTSGYKSYYLDFKTGVSKEIRLDDAGETGYIRTSDHTYVGQNYAAFITSRWDSNDNAENMSYLNRLNLKTFKVEPQIISVKAAETNILGVLSDGRIVFSFNFYPSENGICITK